MRRFYIAPLLLFGTLFMLLSGCGGQDTDDTTDVDSSPTALPSETPEPADPTPTPLTEPRYGLLEIESLEILIAESFPVQVEALVRGVLPNSCAELDDIVAQLEGDTFDLAAIFVQQPGEACAEAEVPIEQTVSLDVAGLAAGTYMVNVNGVEETFDLEVDNLLAEEATEPSPQPDSGSIAGRVWHDLCVGTISEDADVPEGCVNDEGDIKGNGIWEDEPGIEGVAVSLGQGSCPADGLDQTTTDSSGSFTFEELALAVYCVSIDVDERQNQGVLLEGMWTAPPDGVPAVSLDLNEDERRQFANFGWDFDFLPIPDVDLSDCSNSFIFLEDVNIPDDSVIAPGESFTKQWLLRNNGTCPWSEEYSVVFVSGDQMGAADSIPLTEEVTPGQTLTVSIDMVAPEELGTYRGNWQLADPDGEPFGIDGFIEDAFWLRIVVSDEEVVPTPTPLPSSAIIGGVVWDDSCLNNDPGPDCVEFPEDSGIFVANGSLDSGEVRLAEITMSLADDSCPTDGSLPDPGSVIETAITDEDGLFRFTDLDGGTYCVFMDPLSEENVDFLIPGNWTWPATGVGWYTVFLDDGEQILDQDFGWDYTE